MKIMPYSPAAPKRVSRWATSASYTSSRWAWYAAPRVQVLAQVEPATQTEPPVADAALDPREHDDAGVLGAGVVHVEQPDGRCDHDGPPRGGVWTADAEPTT